MLATYLEMFAGGAIIAGRHGAHHISAQKS
jgi:hypothetical protein